MNGIYASIVALSAGVAIYALVAMPTWLFASMNRGCLWRLRDLVFDARRKKALPDLPEVSAFLAEIERTILVLPKLTAAQVWWIGRKIPSTNAGRKRIELSTDDGEAQRLIERMEIELFRIILRQLLVGSWSGILLMAPRYRSLLVYLLSPKFRLAAQDCLPAPAETSDLPVSLSGDALEGLDTPKLWRTYNRVQGEVIPRPKEEGPREKDLVAACP